MNLFKPVWKITDPEKRAKKLDRMDAAELRAVAVNRETSIRVRGEALDRLPEKELLALVYEQAGKTLYDPVGVDAAERLKQPESLAAVAADSRLSPDIRRTALKSIRDEQVLTEVLRGDLASRSEKETALENLRSPELIADLACVQGLFAAGIRSLKALDADEALVRLMLKAENMGYPEAEDGVRRYREDEAVLKRLFAEARSASVRLAALESLPENGRDLPGARQQVRQEMRQLMEAGEPVPLLSHYLRCADPAEPLTEAERQYLYSKLAEEPLYGQALRFLDACGDPAGKAFLCFYDSLYRESSKAYLTREETEQVLQVPEDFALDYLKAFIRKGENAANSKLGGPGTMISGCAGAIRLMYAHGKARERIEKEFPKSQRYEISYRYQDPDDQEIYSETDDFTVGFR